MRDKNFERELITYLNTYYSPKETQALGIKLIVKILYNIYLELKENV